MSRPMDELIRTMSKNGKTRLHEVDIENLVGSGKLNASSISQIKLAYYSAVNFQADDVFVVAAGPQNRLAVIEGWGGAIYMFKKGADGADNALISFFAQIEDKSVFSELFIASGDNKFISVANDASREGIKTTVVTYRGKKSWKLRPFNEIRLGAGLQDA